MILEMENVRYALRTPTSLLEDLDLVVERGERVASSARTARGRAR